MTAATGTADAGRLLDPTLYASGDPFALYAELRRTAPVCWVDHERGGFWAVTTHPEVSHIGADPGGFCSSRGILTDEIGTTYETPPTMMHTDPPQHTRYRRLVQPGFKPSMVRLMEAGVTAKARALLDQIQGGVAFDVVQDLSIPFPLLVICELLGVDGSQWPRFFDWSEAVIPGEVEQTEEQRTAHQIEMWEYLIGVAEERRKAPADDLVSVLANVGADAGERRRGADRGRAGHVLDPAAGGGERDHPQPDLGWARGAGGESRAMGRAAGGSVPDPGRRRRAAALDHARDLLHAHGDRRHHHPRRRGGRRRPGPSGLRLGQPGRGGLRARRRRAAHRPPSRIHT